MLVIVQARMSSTRLPGKVLRPLGGRPMIAWTIDRLRLARTISRIVVATSNDPSDDRLADFCRANRVEVFRGDLECVASRFAGIVRQQMVKSFVRICGDSPLIDPELVDRVVTSHDNLDFDLTTNTQPRTFPKGQSVEIVRTSTFLSGYQLMSESEDFEHVTRYFYNRPYRIFNIDSGAAAGDVQLSVDTAEDFRRIESVLSECGWSPRGWRELRAISSAIK